MALPPKQRPTAITQTVQQIRPPNLRSAFATLARTGDRIVGAVERQRQIARIRFLTEMTPDLRIQLNDLANENFDDPAAFASSVEGLIRGSIENVDDPRLAEAIEVFTRREAASRQINLTNAKFNRDRRAAFVSSETEKDVTRGKIGALARDGDVGTLEFDVALADFTTLQEAQVAQGLKSQEVVDAELAALRTFARSQSMLFTFENMFNDKGRAAANEFARETLTDAENGFTPEEREALDQDFNRLGSRLTRDQNQEAQQARAALQGQLKDAEAAAGRPGGRRRDILADAEIRGAFGKDAEQIIDDLNFIEETTAAVEEMSLMSPQEVNALIQGATPEGEGFDRENRRQATLIRAAQQRQKLLEDDPAQFALTTVPGLATAFQAALQANDPVAVDNVITASMEAQQHMGVLSPRVLPKGMAGRKVELFTSALAEEDRARALVAEINNNKALFGDNFRQVMAEMVEAGLPQEAEGIIYLEEDIGASTRFASAVNQGRDVLRKAAGPDVTEVDAGIEEQLGELSESVSFYADGGRLINSIRASAQLQAYQFAINGQNPQDAANSAGDDFINNRYEFVESYRIPSAFDADRVSLGARQILSGLKVDDFVPLETGPEIDAAIAAAAVDPFGFPVDLTRPQIDNPDGTFSSELSITIDVEKGGKTSFINIPSIVDGKKLSNEDAIRAFKEGRNDLVGEFDTLEEALAAAPIRSSSLEGVHRRARESRAEIQLPSLQANGRWVTNPDDSGLTLMWPAETGLRPVTRLNGEPFTVSFDELETLEIEPLSGGFGGPTTEITSTGFGRRR